MPTAAQILANLHNAKLSTGPHTESGKATSSRNRLTLGLYTRTDYVEPHERDLYKEFCETMHAELAPASLLEETLVSEITGASWRLRRCNAADAGLDFDEATDKLRRSVERARARSTSSRSASSSACARAFSNPRAAFSALRLRTVVRQPPSASVRAIPGPIIPVPITAAFRNPSVMVRLFYSTRAHFPHRFESALWPGP